MMIEVYSKASFLREASCPRACLSKIMAIFLSQVRDFRLCWSSPGGKFLQWSFPDRSIARLLGCSVAASKRRCTTEPPHTSIIRTYLMLCSFYLPSSRLDPVHLIGLAFSAPLSTIIPRVSCLRSLFGVTIERLLEMWAVSRAICPLPSPLQPCTRCPGASGNSDSLRV